MLSLAFTNVLYSLPYTFYKLDPSQVLYVSDLIDRRLHLVIGVWIYIIGWAKHGVTNSSR